MSDDGYGLQDNQFLVKTLPVVLTDKIELAKTLFGGRVSLQEDDLLYQFLLLGAQDDERFWRIIGTIANFVSISNASGIFLDRHGEDLGLKRSGATKATTNLLITGTPGNSIPIGSLFSTYENVQFETTEAASLSATITVTRSSDGNRDSIPSPYSGLVVVDWISDSISGESPYSINDYIVDYDNDVIDWSPAGTQPDDGATYYVRVSSSITVTVAIQSLIGGANQNVPADTITQVVSALSGVSSVTNPSSTGTTGQDSESDRSYRLRLLRAPRRNWTKARIKSLIDAISGVRTSKVLTGDSVDQYNLEQTHTLERETLGQLFRPGERIGSISSTSFFTRVFGTPGDLMVELYTCQYDVLGEINYNSTINSPRMAYARISHTDIDPLHGTEWIEYKNTLKHNHLDNTKRYLLLIYASSDNATNYYEFRYGQSGSYAYGGLYRNGILYENDNLYFKTWFPQASFTPVIAPTTQLTDTLRSTIETSVVGTGKPVAVQMNIEEANSYRIQIRGRIKLVNDEDYTLAGVSSGIENNLLNYLEELDIGDNVIWAEVVWSIMEEPGVADIDEIVIAYKGPQDATFIVLAEGVNLVLGERDIAVQDTVGVQLTQFWSEG